jgi:hypothetical protein
MKNNWGTYIAITYTVFAASMIFMLLRSCGKENPLIAEDYYEQELMLPNIKRYTKNAHLQQVNPQYQIEGNKVIWEFKNVKPVSGSIIYKNLSNEKYDFQTAFNTNQSKKISIDKALVSHGEYQIEIKWHDDKDTFYFKNLMSIL